MRVHKGGRGDWVVLVATVRHLAFTLGERETPQEDLEWRSDMM